MGFLGGLAKALLEVAVESALGGDSSSGGYKTDAMKRLEEIDKEYGNSNRKSAGKSGTTVRRKNNPAPTNKNSISSRKLVSYRCRYCGAPRGSYTGTPPPGICSARKTAKGLPLPHIWIKY